MTTCGYIGSVELWNVKVVKPTGFYWGFWWRTCRFEITVPSTLIVTNWATERSLTSVNMLIHWWTTFQLLTLWLSMSMVLWPQTTYASSCRPNRSGGLRTCVCGSNFFTNTIYHLNFDQFWQSVQSDNQSLIFLLFSACLISCQCQTRLTITNCNGSRVQLKL